MSLKNKILYITTAILAVTFLISFVDIGHDHREKIRTALVNPGQKEKISFFELYDGDKQKITLVKNGNFWEIQKSAENNFEDEKFSAISDFKNVGVVGGGKVFRLPANSKKIEEFLNSVTQIVNMYKISDSFGDENSFMLLEPGYIQMKYGFEDSVYSIYFGAQDFSLTSRYLMTGKNTTVYEVSDFLEKFLTVSVQFWAEPLLVSQEVFGRIDESDVQRAFAKLNENGEEKILKITDVQKLLELRHGGFLETENSNDDENLLEENEDEERDTRNARKEHSEKMSVLENFQNFSNHTEPEMELFLELGNKNSIKLDFFRKSEDSQTSVKSYYKKSDGTSFVFDSKISSWTYNKIKEIML